jgi:hypothetical protein
MLPQAALSGFGAGEHPHSTERRRSGNIVVPTVFLFRSPDKSSFDSALHFSQTLIRIIAADGSVSFN